MGASERKDTERQPRDELRKATALALLVPGTLIAGGGTLHFEEEN